MKTNPYRSLAISLSLSFMIMYAVMFLNVDNSSHIFLSLTRCYMSLLMVTPMAVVMLVTMRKMFPYKRLNTIIGASSTLVFIIALALLRMQWSVGDIQYMKAMIPHHSSAIMTSKHAGIRDPEVKELARSIMESQQQEIKQMEQIIKRLENKPQ